MNDQGRAPAAFPLSSGWSFACGSGRRCRRWMRAVGKNTPCGAGQGEGTPIQPVTHLTDLTDFKLSKITELSAPSTTDYRPSARRPLLRRVIKTLSKTEKHDFYNLLSTIN